MDVRRAVVQSIGTCGRIAAAVVLLPALAIAQGAAPPLAVLGIRPDSLAVTGGAITIAFDRSMVSGLRPADRAADVARFVRVEPALRVRASWRDPVTLRLVPTEQLYPGARYTVTIDTSVRAADGSALPAPSVHVVKVHGSAWGPLNARLQSSGRLPPDGSLVLLTVAPVDSALVADSLSLQLEGSGGCSPSRVRYRLVESRRLHSQQELNVDFREWRFAIDSVRDVARVWRYRPERALPTDCSAILRMPSLDPGDRPTITRSVTTATAFRILSAKMLPPTGATARLVVAFSAAANVDDVRRHVRVEPSDRFDAATLRQEGDNWILDGRATYGDTVRMLVDPSLTDAIGRPLTGEHELRLRVPDLRPMLGYQPDWLVSSRDVPASLRVRHLNVDSIVLRVVAVPDTMLGRLVGPTRAAGDVGAILKQAVDSFVLAIPGAALNRESTSVLPLPASVPWHDGRLRYARLDIRSALGSERTRRGAPALPDTTSLDRHRRPYRLPTVVTHASTESRVLHPWVALQFSDLAAHLVHGGFPAATFVTERATGRPASGVRVAYLDANGSVLGRATTDAEGVVDVGAAARALTARAHADRWAATATRARFVALERGNDRLVLPSFAAMIGGYRYDEYFPRPGFARASFSTPGAMPVRRGAVWSDRGIYRPGEWVYLGAAATEGPTYALRAPARGDSLRLQVSPVRSRPSWNPYVPAGTPDTTTLLRVVRRTSDAGTITDSLALPLDAPLGEYLASVSLFREGAWQAVASRTFRVAEYRAPEFLVTAPSDDRAVLMPDTARAEVRGAYLFGAPMTGASVRWRVQFDPMHDAGWAFPRLPRGFSISDPAAAFRGRVSERPERAGTARLDSVGRVVVPIASPTPPDGSPVRAMVYASVEDLNRQQVSVETSRLLHSSSFYLALRARPGDRTGDFGLDVMAVGIDGARVPPRRVSLAVVQWRQRPGGIFGRDWTGDTTWRGTLLVDDSVAAAVFPRPAGGGFRAVELVAFTDDDRGRPVRSAHVRWLTDYAIWEPSASGGSGDRLALPVRFEIDSGAPVRIGDRVSLAFRSPFPRAEAWIVAHREGVRWQHRSTVDSGVVRVPIDVSAAMAPGATFSVVLVAHGAIPDGGAPESGTRMGHATLSLGVEHQRLRVVVRPDRTEHAPGDRATVAVTVRDQAGRPVRGRVAVWATDEGVLSLTGFATPDPLQPLYASMHPPMGVLSSFPWAPLLSLQWLTRYVSLIERGLVASGAALQAVTVRAEQTPAVAGAQEVAVRTRMRSTAFFVGEIALDSSGEARVTRSLPDNLTTFRLMAVAIAGDGRAGSGESSLRVTKTLLVRAALPRFLRPGDSLDAGGIVNLRRGAPREAEVRAEATALVAAGPPVRTVPLTVAGVDARFSWTLPPGAREGDSAVVTLSARAGALRDAVRSTLPVETVGHPRAVARSGTTAGTDTVRLALAPDTDLARSRVTVRTGNTPLPFLRLATAYLDGFAYECSEQLASRIRVLLAVRMLQRAGTSVGVDSARLDERVRTAVRELLRRSGVDGVRYWRDRPWTTPWASQYAATALMEARAAGFDVPSDVLDDVLRYVQRGMPSIVGQPRADSLRTGTAGERRASLATDWSHVLAAATFARRTGRPDTLAERLLAANVPDMTWEDHAAVALLLHDAGRSGDARRVLDLAWSRVRDAGALVDLPAERVWWYFPSSLRPAARLFSATRRIQPDHPKLGALLERMVSDARSRDAWQWNTQDFGTAVPALASAMLDAGTTSRVRDTTWRASDLARASHGDSIVLLVPVMRDLTGGARTFYAVNAVEVPRQRPVTPDRKGLVVERWFERYADGAPVTEVAEGTLVRVNLRVTAAAGREFVAVEDLLPAGLEAVDVSLRTSGIGAFSDSLARQAEHEAWLDRDEPFSDWWGAGRWYGGWWSPWEHTEIRDDRVRWFARRLSPGSHTVSYVARATTAGRFVLPPAHAEEMYNPGVNGRSDGGWFEVLRGGSR